MKTESVLIGISGGVDSAVAAYLLKKAGYHVEGLYIYNGFPNRSEDDAVRVAACLSIPLHRIDIAGAFRNNIVDYFISEYLSARTPNPCIVCNKRIKFAYLLDEAEKRGLDYIATGHYARIDDAGGENGLRLARGKDREKDQTYFLFQLGQRELARLLLPNGEMTKDDVKKIGANLKLGTLTERESQEICFIPSDNYRDFIEHEVTPSPFRPGDIVDRYGTVVGRHRGIHSVTIGQRRGLNIASERPYYVIGIDKSQNEVVVGREEDQFFTGLVAGCVSWVSPEFRNPDYIRTRTYIRYRHRGVDSEISVTGHTGTGDTVSVQFETPQKAVAPGQAAVFYHGDILIGGGWIEEGMCDE